MRERPGDPRSLKALRDELVALTRRSMETLTEIARIQLRIHELSKRLAREQREDGPESTDGSSDGAAEPD
jgi:hypothetical protein